MTPIRLQIRRLPDNDDLPLPRAMTAGSAGLDLCAAVTEPLVLHSGDIATVSCGFAMALPHGYEAQVRPRSGLASRHGIVPVNSPGTIDADYRGEVKVPLINLGRETFTIGRGLRIAQMIIAPVPPVEIEEVTELDDTARGEGGFGSTGH